MSWDLQLPGVRHSGEPEGTMDLYESVVTHIAGFVLSVSVQEFLSVEQILLESVMQPTIWRALLAMDVWCIIARYELSFFILWLPYFSCSRCSFICSVSFLTSQMLVFSSEPLILLLFLSLCSTLLSIVTGCSLVNQGLIPGRGRDLPLCHSIQTCSGTHPAIYPVGNRGSFSGVE